MSTFRCYLEDRLFAAGLTQAEFAEKIGISRQYLSDIKNGGRPPSDTVLDGMANHLGCDRDEAYWVAGRITPDVESLVIEVGPEAWREWRNSYYGTA